MAEIWLRNIDADSITPVDDGNPLPIKTVSVPSNTTSFLPVLGDAQITVSTTAVRLSSVTGGIPSGSVGALCVCETNPIRITESGSQPTASVGYPYSAGDRFYVWGIQNLVNCLLIRSAGGDATVTMQFLGGVLQA